MCLAFAPRVPASGAPRHGSNDRERVGREQAPRYREQAPRFQVAQAMGYTLPKQEVPEQRERDNTVVVSRQTTAAAQQPAGKASESASVAELVEMILDKGIVIDAWARVSVLGLELLTIEARVMVASVETYLRYADMIGRIGTAAPPRWQQAASGGENEQVRLLEGEVLRSLSEHPEGLQPETMQALLDAPRERLDEILNHLAEDQKVHREEEHNLWLPEEQ